MLCAGSDLAEVLQHLEITESTWRRWRHAYASMSARRREETQGSWRPRMPR